RERHAGLPGERLDDGLDARPLVRGRDLWRAGTRRFAANIEDVGAIGHHAECIGDRGLRVEPDAAVRERVRGDVDDADNECPTTEFEDPAVRQGNTECGAGNLPTPARRACRATARWASARWPRGAARRRSASGCRPWAGAPRAAAGPARAA